MGRIEQRLRVVVEVTHDAADLCPVEVGSGQGLILATWLAGAEVRITDVGPALGLGERERGPFQEMLELTIGRRVEALGNRLQRASRTPRRGTNERDKHFQLEGNIRGLTDAYRMLTGEAALAAEDRGREAWAADAPRRAAQEADMMRSFLEEPADASEPEAGEVR